MERYCPRYSSHNDRLCGDSHGGGYTGPTHGCRGRARSRSNPSTVNRSRGATTPACSASFPAGRIRAPGSPLDSHPRNRIEPRHWRSGNLGRVSETKGFANCLPYRENGRHRKRAGTPAISGGIPGGCQTHLLAPEHWTKTRIGLGRNRHWALHDPLPPRVHRDLRWHRVSGVLRD